jgi:hypothetical protein
METSWTIEITSGGKRWSATTDKRPPRDMAESIAQATGGPGALWRVLPPGDNAEPVETGAVVERLIGAWAETLQYADLRERDRQLNDNRATMTELAERFHVLKGEPGVRPWDAAKLDRWAVSAAPTPATRQAAAFVLHVWNSSNEWKAGPFDAVRALSSWDARNRAAFLSWAAAPWWP